MATRLIYTRGHFAVIERAIVELETEDSAHTYDAIVQADAFREAAAQDPNITFPIRMA